MNEPCHTGGCPRAAVGQGPYGEAFCEPCAVAEARHYLLMQHIRRNRMDIPKTKKRRQT